MPRLSCVFTIYDQLGIAIASFNSEQRGDQDTADSHIGSKLICRVDQLPLMPGQYRLNVLIRGDSVIQDHLEGAAIFDVEPGVIHGRPVAIKSNGSKVCVSHAWTVPN